MKKIFTKFSIALCAYCLFSFNIKAQTTYHVNAANASPGDGLTWTAAFNSLQAALNVAVSGDEIRVAQGTYKPSEMFAPGVASPGTAGPDNRYNTFQLKSGVSVYGGYDDQGNDTRDVVA